MTHASHSRITSAIFSLCGAVLLYSCASPGTPSGGPRDEQPPRFVRATPPQGATDVDPKRIVLEFDELVNVKDPLTAVVVSPPSSTPPRITTSGRRVIVTFPDTLRSNTTYTMDFGNSIQDVNESNKLQGFTYSFSTGPLIDTLQIAGMVLGARNLEPQQNMLVGVHSADAPDSAFRTQPFLRMAKTDDRGRFIMRGLAPGEYRLYALADANNDYRWDNPEEDIAFTSYTIVPYTEQVVARDTVWNLREASVDTVVERMRTRFLPNDVLLNSFNINFKQQYLVKNERPDSMRVSLIFNAPATAMPEISLISPSAPQDWYVAEHSIGNDTITLWIKAPEVLSTDTLRLALGYEATDRSMRLSHRNDTLRLISPKRPAVKKSVSKNANDTIPQIEFLSMKTTSSSQDVSSPLILDFDRPVAHIEEGAFRLEQRVDTVWRPVASRLSLRPLDSISVRRYAMDVPWEYGARYRLTADSLAVEDIYGRFTRPLEQEFTVKNRDEYFDLRFRITSLPDSIPCFVELLNGQDEPVRVSVVRDGVAELLNVPLGTYYARLVEDRNGNGVYDTGSYEQDLQPEYVYYYPKALKITKRWDLEQPWDLTATAINEQKPASLKKNKPEAGPSRRGKKNAPASTEQDDEVFDPTRNPFDPNDRGRRRSTTGSY